MKSPKRRNPWREASQVQRDIALGVLGATLAVVGLLFESSETGYPSSPAGPLVIGLMIVSGGALATRRRLPLLSAVVSVAASTVAIELGYAAFLPEILSEVVVGVCAANASRRSIFVMGAILVAAAVVLDLAEGYSGAVELTNSVAFAAIPVAIGYAFKVRGELAEEAVDRAERVERLRELELAQAVDEERLRIARDVHDVIGHHLSAISIQAKVGERMLARGEAEELIEPVDSIGRSSANALAETRRLLSMVRSDARLRATGLCRSEEIVALAVEAEGSGLEVAVRRFGIERPLEGLVGECAYRLVQEALTNVNRHAAACHAVVELSYGPESVVVQIDDDGRGGRRAGFGHGLIGMRERVAVAGGELDVGPGAGRGWRVRARLPYEPAEASV